MIPQTLAQLFERDLKRLKKEIEQYTDESAMWSIVDGISNSGGNLCLHLIGNLNAFIGVPLANSDYQRDRPFEFAGKDVPKEKLLADIDATIEMINQSVGVLTDSQLSEDYPNQIWGKPTKTDFTLLQLYGHFNYHLGQINYHRRIVTNV